MTTRLLKFSGQNLTVNAFCPEGELRAEILDENGKPLPGFSAEQCDPFQGDAVRHTFVWQGRGDLSPLHDQPIRFRFHLRQGDRYSFQVK